MHRRELWCIVLLGLLISACQGPPPTQIVLVVTATPQSEAVAQEVAREPAPPARATEEDAQVLPFTGSALTPLPTAIAPASGSGFPHAGTPVPNDGPAATHTNHPPDPGRGADLRARSHVLVTTHPANLGDGRLPRRARASGSSTRISSGRATPSPTPLSSRRTRSCSNRSAALVGFGATGPGCANCWAGPRLTNLALSRATNFIRHPASPVALARLHLITCCSVSTAKASASTMSKMAGPGSSISIR